MRRPLFFVLALVLLAASSGSAPAPASDPGAAAPVEEFHPTLRVPADEAVSFPVDI